MVNSYCEDTIDKLTSTERRLLWLWSDAFEEVDDEVTEPLELYAQWDVVAHLIGRVGYVAMNEPLKNCDDRSDEPEFDAGER